MPSGDTSRSLIGDTLLAVLRQPRAGYPGRPRHFPGSVILCGVRDVRDFPIRSTWFEDEARAGPPPSNQRRRHAGRPRAAARHAARLPPG